jgi:hypothetical protein
VRKLFLLFPHRLKLPQIRLDARCRKAIRIKSVETILDAADTECPRHMGWLKGARFPARYTRQADFQSAAVTNPAHKNYLLP